MQAKNDFSIEGLDELIKAFAKLPDEAIVKLDPAINESGDFLLDNTKHELDAATDEHSGNLKRSLYLKQSRTKKYKKEKVLTWHDDVRAYGAPLELGHAVKFSKGGPVVGRAKPHPFLRPAADKSKEHIFDTITKAMDKTLDEMGGIK